MRRKSISNSPWETRELNLSFLTDSGLLFEINRSILHLFGITLEVSGGDIVLKDSRQEPEKAIYTKESFELNRDRLRDFLEKFGRTQIDKRSKKLGWGAQPLGAI